MSSNASQEVFDLSGGLPGSGDFDFGLAGFASMPTLPSLEIPHLDIGLPARKTVSKKRRHFGRGVQERRVLHQCLTERLADKIDFSAEEHKAFADLKTFDCWAPVYPQDLITATIPGDWVMFSKPKFHDQPKSERKRIVCKVAGKTENSITFETIAATRELSPDYSWTYRWDDEASDLDIFNTITGHGTKQYYMRIPSTKSVAPRPKKAPGAPRKKIKTENFTCRHCGKDQSDPPPTAAPDTQVPTIKTEDDLEDGEVTE